MGSAAFICCVLFVGKVNSRFDALWDICIFRNCACDLGFASEYTSDYVKEYISEYGSEYGSECNSEYISECISEKGSSPNNSHNKLGTYKGGGAV